MKVGGPLAVSEQLVLYYEPGWVENEDELVLATGLAHEVWHDQLNHCARGKNFSRPDIFNQAADLWINQVLRKQTKTVNGDEEPMWKVPDWFLVPEQYGFPLGLSADQYYELLIHREEEGGGEDDDDDCEGDSEGEGGEGGEGGDDEGKGKGGKGKKMVGGGCCGGIAGNPLSRELEKQTDESMGRSDAECQNIRKNTSHEVKKAMEASAGCGDMPGEYSELIKLDDEASTIPWTAKLQRVVRYTVGNVKVGGLDYSRRRPSKRSFLRGIQLPGLVKREFTILFVLDTSGSMGYKQLSAGLKEVVGVLRQTGVDFAWLLESDAAVAAEPKRVTISDLYEYEMHGRGGTDFRPAFDAARKLKPKPDIIIYITDGDGPAPKEAPIDFATIWCVVPTPHGRRPADWGELVVISDDQRLAKPYYSAA